MIEFHLSQGNFGLMDKMRPKKSDKYETLRTRETLIRSMKDDDEGAWTVFYDRYHALILNFAMKRGCPRPLAEDILQETVIALVKHLKNFDYDREKGGFKSLLFKITESKIVDTFRREGKISLLKDSEIFLKNLPNEEDVEKKEQMWDEEWKKQVLTEAIDVTKKRVDLRTFKCFEEIFLKGRTVKETAGKFKITPNLVSQHKFKVTKLVTEIAKKIFDSYQEFK